MLCASLRGVFAACNSFPSVPEKHLAGAPVINISADKAAKIWYKALNTYKTSSTNFAGARTATLNAANALYGVGSAESVSVAQAWTACGIP